MKSNTKYSNPTTIHKNIIKNQSKLKINTHNQPLTKKNIYNHIIIIFYKHQIN